MSAERELLADSTPKPLVEGETIAEFIDVWKAYARRDVLAGVSLKIVFIARFKTLAATLSNRAHPANSTCQNVCVASSW